MAFRKWLCICLQVLLPCALFTTVCRALQSSKEVVPGAYIVEFFNDIDSTSFFTNVSGSGLHTKPRRTLNHVHFNGASFYLHNSHDNETSHNIIRSMEGVKRLSPVKLGHAPRSMKEIHNRRSFNSLHLRHRATAVDSDSYAPHVMGGVDRLRSEGYFGSGIFIGIVDTGVDYNHPALGGGFGPGYKIAAGYDLVGDSYDGSGDPVPDSDPMDCNGHGTHVSGIIGANPNPYNFTGVVPNATLGMWKVTGCSGYVANDVMISGFNMAFEAGVDVISSSIDFDDGWAEDPVAAVVQRIVDAGVPVSISAGNLGVLGPFNSQAPSVAIGATSVGSVDSTTNVTAIPNSVNSTSNPPIISSPPNTLTGGYASFFSSWGPSSEGALKPQILAPGGHILSTYPMNLGSYEVLSGTSMAAPYIAGVLALMKEVRGSSLTPHIANALLTTSAAPVKYQDFWSNETFDYLAPAIQQGGGLVDAYSAAHCTTILTPSDIALNDTLHFTSQQAITIQNLGNTSVIYHVSHLPASAAYSLGMGVPYNKTSLVGVAATVSFAPSSITVAAGGAGVVLATFEPPVGLNASRIPVYSGFISINSTAAIESATPGSFSIPYVGIAADMKYIAVMDVAESYPFLASSDIQTYANGTTATNLSPPISASNSSFTLPGNATNFRVTAWPTLVWKLQYGSRIVRIDMVPRNGTGLPSVLGQRILGSFSGYPSYNVGARYTNVVSEWDGSLANGTYAPAGTYKFLVRVLKIFGNETDVDDYEQYSTPFFSIGYAGSYIDILYPRRFY